MVCPTDRDNDGTSLGYFGDFLPLLADVTAGTYANAAPSGWIIDPNLASTVGTDNSIGYAGYVFNAETEQYQVRFRNYDPETGRWLQRDPLGYADGANVYLYGAATPISNVDPLGLRSGVIEKLRDAAQNAWDCLGEDDQNAMSKFYNTQKCILNNLKKCAKAAGPCPAQQDQASDWIDAVASDFMAPFTNSLNERCDGGAITDGGWDAFFKDLDGGDLDGRIVSGLAGQVLKLLLMGLFETFNSATRGNKDIYGEDRDDMPAYYEGDDFLLAKSHRVAQAMAMNHINNDLRQSLQNNGVGNDKVWDCIGDAIQKCHDKYMNWFEELGADTTGYLFPDTVDVKRIRDNMRNKVRENG